MSVVEFIQGIIHACNIEKRVAAFAQLVVHLEEEDISNVIELKLMSAQLVNNIFEKSGLQTGGRLMLARALAPHAVAGWSWEPTRPNGTPQSAETMSYTTEPGQYSFPEKLKVHRWWNTAPKYTHHTYEGDIRKLELPESLLKELPPPTDYLSYNSMKKVGNAVWLAIQAHPQLRGGGLSTECAERLAAVLGARYPNLEPMNRKLAPEHQRKRTWKDYLITTFKNRRLRTYKAVVLPKGTLKQTACVYHISLHLPLLCSQVLQMSSMSVCAARCSLMRLPIRRTLSFRSQSGAGSSWSPRSWSQHPCLWM